MQVRESRPERRSMAAVSRLVVRFAVSVGGAIGLCLTVPAASAEDSGAPTVVRSPVDAVRQGKLLTSLRYRYENVEDDAFEKSARASTLRTTLGWETAAWRGVRLLVEFENVADLGLGDLHADGASASATNGVTDRPLIIDPDGSELQQLHLRWQPRPDLTLLTGREELNVGNERFVGAVGWRQNHQSLDLTRIEWRASKKATVGYGYLWGVNRVDGRRDDVAGHLVRGSIALHESLTLHATGLLLDYDAAAVASRSSRTVAVGLIGARALGAWRLLYDAEIAHQQEAADNPFNVDEGYLRLEAGAQRGPVTLRAGFEHLGGSTRPADRPFSTPLATLHKWQGWADRLTVTPAQGVQDLYLGLHVETGPWRAAVVYHDFSADRGGAGLATEWNVEASYRAPWRQAFTLKAAAFDAETISTDVVKLWLFTAWTL